jgi:hypothetical protein
LPLTRSEEANTVSNRRRCRRSRRKDRQVGSHEHQAICTIETKRGLCLILEFFDWGRIGAVVLVAVLLGEGGFLTWITNETVGLCPLVLFAPIAGFLASLSDFLATQAALFFRQAVFVTPPVAVIVTVTACGTVRLGLPTTCGEKS